MKKLKELILFFCTVLLFSCLPFSNTYSLERKEHDKYMEKVLFDNFLQPGNNNNKLAALESASYLAIDQFNGFGQEDLDILDKNGVKDLPVLNEIDYSASGKTHRNATHRGWDHPYVGSDKDRWNRRKQILLNTADAIFDFEGNENQKESFCALIYYTHIIGDLMAEKSFKIQNGLIMDPGGTNDKANVIDELLKHFKILFADQKSTHKYLTLTKKMEQYNANLSIIVRSKGGINSDEKFKKRQEYVEKLMNLLPMYLPEMLKEEKFFYEVFYQ